MLGTAALLACGFLDPAAAGERSLERGDLATAEVHFRRALERNPADVPSVAGLGRVLLLAGRIDQADQAFRACAAAHPARVECPRGLASVALARGDREAARDRLAEALRLAPGDFGSRHAGALLDLGSGQAATALATLDQLAAEDASSAEVELARAEALVELHRLDEAHEAAERAYGLARGARGRAAADAERARVLVARARAASGNGECAEAKRLAAAADASLDRAEAAGFPASGGDGTRRAARRLRQDGEAGCPSPGDPAPAGG
jgi:tetratricopeptide (TPR) repeat protein